MTASVEQSQIEFWFDPACPFTWRTSVWLRELVDRGLVSVRWRLMSLAVLNEAEDVSAERRALLRRSSAALRMLAAADEHGGNDAVGKLYAALGSARHEAGADLEPPVFRAAVRQAGLPEDLVDAADDARRDAVVRSSHEEAQRRVGTGSGSPILAVDGGRGFFGPVVVPPPLGEQAETLFRAVKLLSSVPAFSELKTARADL